MSLYSTLPKTAFSYCCYSLGCEPLLLPCNEWQNNENGRSQEVEVFCRQRLEGGHLEISVGLTNYSVEYICCGIHACTRRRHQWGSIQLLSESVHNVGPKNWNISWCGALHNVISFLVLLFLGLSILVSLRRGEGVFLMGTKRCVAKTYLLSNGVLVDGWRLLKTWSDLHGGRCSRKGGISLPHRTRRRWPADIEKEFGSDLHYAGIKLCL